MGINHACRLRPGAARALVARAASPVRRPCLCHPRSASEGGDFIAHAAQSRDNGMTREAFLDKLVDDIRLIQAFPPSLRWFVVDPGRRRNSCTPSRPRVFDAPHSHRSRIARSFLSHCFDR